MDTPTGQARIAFLAALVGILMISTVGGAVTESGKARQPRNIYELIYDGGYFWERAPSRRVEAIQDDEPKGAQKEESSAL